MYHHYNTLDIDVWASEKKVKAAYKSLAQKCHPDKWGYAPRFIQINTAYQALIEHIRRVEDDSYKYYSERFNDWPETHNESELFIWSDYTEDDNIPANIKEKFMECSWVSYEEIHSNLCEWAAYWNIESLERWLMVIAYHFPNSDSIEIYTSSLNQTKRNIEYSKWCKDIDELWGIGLRRFEDKFWLELDKAIQLSFTYMKDGEFEFASKCIKLMEEYYPSLHALQILKKECSSKINH